MTDIRPAQGTHFWFMSLIVPSPVGFDSYRRCGHFTPDPGMTRHDAFELLLAAVKEQSPELRTHAVVISFDVQPNQL
ncbi:hypothetical protein ABZ876_08350 [Streptomyces sp. NPDC046931]|uniref:hypothetical protein n=1 Tax=Streptomyces sp. NPDC046931 TaxID=3154806 RepID=UPI0033C3158A